MSFEEGYPPLGLTQHPEEGKPPLGLTQRRVTLSGSDPEEGNPLWGAVHRPGGPICSEDWIMVELI